MVSGLCAHGTMQASAKHAPEPAALELLCHGIDNSYACYVYPYRYNRAGRHVCVVYSVRIDEAAGVLRAFRKKSAPQSTVKQVEGTSKVVLAHYRITVNHDDTQRPSSWC